MVAKKGGGWEVIEHNIIGPGDSTIKHGYFKVSVKNFTTDYKGRLILTFFNNQLMWIWGYPQDWESYKVDLEKKYNEKLFIGYEETIEGRLIFRVYKDYKKEIYVAWEDKCLSEIQNNWIDKYT